MPIIDVASLVIYASGIINHAYQNCLLVLNFPATNYDLGQVGFTIQIAFFCSEIFPMPIINETPVLSFIFERCRCS